MLKKLLFIFCVSITTIAFSQEKAIEKLAAAPNPFSNSTKITFNATSKSTVVLSVKNVLGKTVFKKEYNTDIGKNSITFYKNDLSTGIYIYSIQDKKKITSKRFVIQ